MEKAEEEREVEEGEVAGEEEEIFKPGGGKVVALDFPFFKGEELEEEVEGGDVEVEGGEGGEEAKGAEYLPNCPMMTSYHFIMT